MMNYAGNVWKYNALNFFRGIGAGLFVPIVVLFFLDRGVSLETFMILMGVLNFSVFALEIPGGIVADRYSRKWSVVLGRFFMLLSFAIITMTTNVLLLGLAFFFYGLGESLVSGADSALLYDSLKAVNREKDFQEAFGTGFSIMLVTMVLGTIASGYLVELAGLAAPMWAVVVVSLVGMLPPLLFVEPPFKNETARNAIATRSFKGEFQSYLRHTRDSLRLILADRTFLILAFVNIAIVRMCLFSDRPFAQPYLRTFGYDAATIGYLYVIFLSISAFFAKYSRKIVSRIGDGERNGLITVCVLGLISLIAMVQAPTGVLLVVALAGLNLVKGLTVPFVQAALNHRLTSDKRASCLSMAKMGINFLGIFVGPMFGWFADKYSLSTSLDVFQWIFGVLLIGGVLLTALGLRAEPEYEIKAGT